MSLRLRLLASSTLVCGDRRALALERKSAALVARLALGGGAPRGVLAGLLWPERPEAAARNNLSQTVRRLRLAAGDPPLVVGGDRLALAEGTAVDVAELQAEAAAGRHEIVALREGRLLADHEYEDCPDFADWLAHQRQRLDRLRAASLAALADARAADGDLRGAIGWVERLLDLDPLREEAHRRLIELRWRAGDRGAALAAFDRCRSLLSTHLGVDPMPETERLAHEIRAVAPASPAAARRPRAIPLSVLRPPLLVDREEAWGRMDEAWQRGQAIFLCGTAGLGKTRLAEEFLATKGRWFRFEGRPEDAGVPYATHVRSYRTMLAELPGLALPGWVRRELSRLLPELGERPPPLRSEDDRLRFVQAQTEATRLAFEAGMRQLLADNLHLVDLASLVAGHFVYAQHWGRPDGMRTVLCLREEELRPEVAAALRRVLDAGLGVRIELEPLSAEGVWRLLHSLDLAVEPLAAAVHRRTGGNPFFVLETLESRIANDELADSGPWRTPGTVKAAIRRRLERLGPEAVQLARVAAIAGARFDLALAARLLEQPATALVVPWAELEAARILEGEGFAHDLLPETLLESIPVPVRAYLEARLKEEAAL